MVLMSSLQEDVTVYCLFQTVDIHASPRVTISRWTTTGATSSTGAWRAACTPPTARQVGAGNSRSFP